MRLAAPCNTKKTARRFTARVRSHSSSVSSSSCRTSAIPALLGQIEHTLNVVCTGNVRLDGRLPKLVSKGFCAVTIYVGQQQLRAIPYHASSAGGADATRSARDERMNALQPVSHLTSASYRRRIRRKRVQKPRGNYWRMSLTKATASIAARAYPMVGSGKL